MIIGYTENQYYYAKNLLLQLGMENDLAINQYLIGLDNVYGKEVEYAPRKWGHTVVECIENIKEEIELKKFKWRIKDNKINTDDKITATDLASYIFCPASYSIKKSFRIDAPSNIKSTEIGTALHEKLRLSQQIAKRKTGIALESIYNEPILQSIINSKDIFTGHDDENFYFENKAENFRGVPDYIFRNDSNEIFVVEEKYIFKSINEEDHQTVFFNNHKVQLISYLRNIENYDIKFGYLIYWFYDYEITRPYVHKYSILKIIYDEKAELLYQKAKNGIINLQENQQQEFAINNINLKKCAACVVNKYCGHKTQKFNELSLPYNRKYMLKKYIPRLKKRLDKFLAETFPHSNLKEEFGEIVCESGFTISLPLQKIGVPTNVTDGTQTAISIFDYIFSLSNQSIWALINDWSINGSDFVLDQFNKKHENSDSWESNLMGENKRRQIFLIKEKSEINYINLFKGLASNVPYIKSRIYFIDPLANIVFMFWDNSIYIGCKSSEIIKPIYEMYYNQINEYSRFEFENNIC
jgi:uncharacterized protein YcfL